MVEDLLVMGHESWETPEIQQILFWLSVLVENPATFLPSLEFK
jgi:hypothetical protein